MVARCTFKSDDVVIKAPNDKRLYRVIELDNGLISLVVHDPDIHLDGPDDILETSESSEEELDEEEMDEEMDEESEEDNCNAFNEDCKGESNRAKGTEKQNDAGLQTKKAAAAMCVAMGSFSDPVEAQGLAHFLEHMLFMGSVNFPDENEYDSYLSKHGGSTNAYTETERTCYYFDVKYQFLLGALKRFSQFFISPLLKKEAMEREVLAVDSEFNQVLQNDESRLQQLQCHTSGPGHLFNRFCWGNEKSLIDAMKKGVNLQEHIWKLYREYYYGGLMRLVVIGGESLDILQSWVVELFGDIRKGPCLEPKFCSEFPMWKPGKLYRLAGIKDVHILNLLWTLPCLRKDYLKKSEDYFAHLLGHEGHGSIFSLLKARGWASCLSAGVGDDGLLQSSVAYMFGVTIYLTDSGLENIFDIISIVYQYLKLLWLTSPQEWIFKELQNIGNMEFRFSDDQAQDDYAAALAENLLIYPVEHVIYGDYVYKIWDEEKIKYIHGFFTPNNMRIDVTSKSFTKLEDCHFEPWFGTCYSEESIPISFMELWSEPPEINSELHLPSENEFIPSHFSSCLDNITNGPAHSPTPNCIIDEPQMKLWYKLDRTFLVPRMNAYFRIYLNEAFNNLRNCVLAELFVLLLKDELNEILYQASIAKLETSVNFVDGKLDLKIYGFCDKIPSLLLKIAVIIQSFLPTSDRFRVIKEDVDRSLKNAILKPLHHSLYLRLEILCKTFYSVEEKLHILTDVSLEDLLLFIPLLRSQLYIEALCHGNLLEGEAVTLSNIFKGTISSQPLPAILRHEEHVLCFPLGANFARDVNVMNNSDTNSVVELYFQLELDVGLDSIKLKALVDLFGEIIEEPFFNQLRTKEQLGYVVDCGPRTVYRVDGFCFRVQSSKHSPVYLQRRIDVFINGLEELFDRLDDESLENYKSGLMAKLLAKDPSLKYEAKRLWQQITDQRYIFDYPVKEAKKLVELCKNDVVVFYKTYFRQPSPMCRRLAVRLWGCNSDINDQCRLLKMDSEQIINDVVSFKLSSKYYPCVC